MHRLPNIRSLALVAGAESEVLCRGGELPEYSPPLNGKRGLSPEFNLENLFDTQRVHLSLCLLIIGSGEKVFSGFANRPYIFAPPSGFEGFWKLFLFKNSGE